MAMHGVKLDDKSYEFHKISDIFPTDSTECYLYGAGLWGRICGTLLQEAFPGISLTFVDRNAEQLGEVLGCPVVKPEVFSQKNPSCPLILCVAGDRDQVFRWYLEAQRDLQQLFCFSASDPERTFFGGGATQCSLLPWREWSLGFYHYSKLNYASEEIFQGISAEIPAMRELFLGENQLFSEPEGKNIGDLPKLSVIIPVYQVAEYLDRCIQSVVNQTYKNLEIILIDDGSKDGGELLCDQWRALDTRVIVEHQENRGTGYCRNRGRKLATGEFITFCDSDDYLHPQAYALAVSTLLSLDCDMVEYHYKRTEKEEISAPITQAVAYVESAQEAVLGMMVGINHTSVIWAKVYRKELLEGLKCREDRILDDEFFLTQYLGRANRVATLPVPLYYYYQRPSSYMNRSFDLTRTQGLEAVVERYFVLKEMLPTLENFLLNHCLFLFDVTLERYRETEILPEAKAKMIVLLKPIQKSILDDPFVLETVKAYYRELFSS